MTTNDATKTAGMQAPAVLRLLAAPDPQTIRLLAITGWCPVLPDDGTPTWIRSGGERDALAR